MSDFDYEEAHYWWTINDVCGLIRHYGYTKVLLDIDKSLKSSDLSVTVDNIVDFSNNESKDVE